MNVLMVFSAYMAFVYVPWDLFLKPVAVDEEVWFGVLFTGPAAKLLEIPHWIVYAAGAYGFRRMRPWMWPWAAVYTAQIAIGMLVWCVLYAPGGALRWVFASVPFAAFGGLALALWRAKPVFRPPRGTLRARYGTGDDRPSWALVTGASAGLGEEFARALASDGFGVVLTARREDRLIALASRLERDFGISTRVVVADLSDPKGADAVIDAVSDLEIALLVNNAGFGYQGRFDLQDTDRLRDMVQVNCVAPVVLTSRLVPGMRARGRGAIVITGSVAGRQPLPLHSVYGATKGFDQLFGEGVAAELREYDIDVLVLEPGSTDTEFPNVAGELAHPGDSPALVVREALGALGYQPTVIYGWLNWARAIVAMRLAPRPLAAAVAAKVMERQTPEHMR
jgi:short-subunit dehydrogenase